MVALRKNIKTSASDKNLLVLLGHRWIKNTAAWFGELSFPGRWLPTMVLGLELPHR